MRIPGLIRASLAVVIVNYNYARFVADAVDSVGT